MKTVAAIWLIFLAVLGSLAGAEAPVRIADTIGDDALRTAAVRLALSGKPVACIQEKVSLKAALAGLQQGKYHLVLAYRSMLPEAVVAAGRDYAVEAAMITVHTRNSRSSFTSTELAEVFSGWRRSWLTFGGGDFQIHLMRQNDSAFAVRLFQRKVMGKLAFAAAYQREQTVELLRMAMLNEHAMVLTGRPDAELSTGLKAVAVDGVQPTLAEIKSGRYPLSERRVVLTAESMPEAAGKLLDFLFSADMGIILAGHGLIQP